MISWRSAIVAGALLAGCTGSEQVAVPDAASVGTIEVCSVGCIKTGDAAFIAQATKALAGFRGGWQTELQMTLSTGWFTYPTSKESVVFRDKQGRTALVLWFGPDWMGARVESNRYFRKVRQSEVAPLRAALRMKRP